MILADFLVDVVEVENNILLINLFNDNKEIKSRYFFKVKNYSIMYHYSTTLAQQNCSVNAASYDSLFIHYRERI